MAGPLRGRIRLPRGRRAAALSAALFLAGAVPLLRAALAARLAAPEPTVLLLDRSGRFLGEVGAAPDGTLGYWPLAALPPRVAAATLAVEDRRFARHPGVDPVAVLRAAWQNLRARRRVSGASTIAMQVARLQAPGRRTWGRKLAEAAAALGLTARCGREAVLRHYLRIVPYGNRIRGIAYAARRYLDKPVEDLSWAETAFLCAIPQAPGTMNPYRPAGRARAAARAARILRLLEARGALTAATRAGAEAELRDLRIPPLPRRPPDALHPLLALERRLTEPAARRRLPTPPLVRTSLDLDLQRELSLRVFEALRRWEGKGPRNAALIVAERETGLVRAWVGSGGYFDESAAGAIDYTGVARLAGSTLKPFFYALALERGLLSPGDVLVDRRRSPSGIENADGRALGPLLPRYALANSRNVPAAAVLERVGLGEGYGLLGALGLHDGRHPARRYGIGLAVGSLPVTLEDLVGAYTALAGDGVRRPLRWWEGQESPPPRRVLDEAAVRQVTLFLADPLARLPTFPRMGPSEFPFPVAVKTGTSADYRDAWCVAWSRRYLAGAWVGRPDYRPMRKMGGYAAAAPLVSDALRLLHRGEEDGLADLAFPPPRGARPVRLCALTGRRAGPACDRVTAEWFAPGREPAGECAAHRLVAVDRRSGRPPGPGTPARFVEARPALLPGLSAAAAGAGETVVRIVSPPAGVAYAADPEVPRAQASIALEVDVDPPAVQVLWEVDGRPFALAAPPYTVRWPLAPGRHTFRARVPYTPFVSTRVTTRVF